MASIYYQLPQFSPRFIPVWQRNFLVWRKLAFTSVVGNIAEPLITLVAFGYGLGSSCRVSMACRISPTWPAARFACP